VPSFIVEIPTAELHKNFPKILLPAGETSLKRWKFSTIVLGGTAALHAYRAWGAVIFWGTNVRRFLLARDLLLLDCV
jgi:hypothetical protein